MTYSISTGIKLNSAPNDTLHRDGNLNGDKNQHYSHKALFNSSFKNHTYTKVTQTSFRSESETKMAGRRRTERAQFSLSTTELGATQRRGGGDIMALREREREKECSNFWTS